MEAAFEPPEMEDKGIEDWEFTEDVAATRMDMISQTFLTLDPKDPTRSSRSEDASSMIFE